MIVSQHVSLRATGRVRAAELTGGGGGGGSGGGSGGNHWHGSDDDSAGDGALPYTAVLTVAGLDMMEGWNGRRKAQPAIKRQAASPLMAALSAVAVASSAAAAQPVNCSSGTDSCTVQTENGSSSCAAAAVCSPEHSTSGSGTSGGPAAATSHEGSEAADAEAAAPPPKRIVMLVEPSPFTYCSGYQTRFRATIREMVAEGCQVLVVTPGGPAVQRTRQACGCHACRRCKRFLLVAQRIDTRIRSHPIATPRLPAGLPLQGGAQRGCCRGARSSLPSLKAREWWRLAPSPAPATGAQWRGGATALVQCCIGQAASSPGNSWGWYAPLQCCSPAAQYQWLPTQMPVPVNNEAIPCSACSSVPLSLGLSPRIFKHVK